jgi:hypothetical protein
MTGGTGPQRSVKHDWLDDVLAETTIDGHAVAVATSLWSHMNREGVCWPSLRLIAAEAKVAQNTAQHRIAMLERAGLLVVKRQPRRANTYQASASRRDTDNRTASPGDTVSRSRRSGAPSASRGELSYLDGLDAEIGTILDSLDDDLADKLTEEFSDAYTVDVFHERLDRYGGCYEHVDIGPRCSERHFRDELTSKEFSAVDHISKQVIVWRLNREDPPPSWLKPTVERRDRFFAEAAARNALRAERST